MIALLIEIYCITIQSDFIFGGIQIDFFTIKNDFNHQRYFVMILIIFIIYILSYLSNKNKWKLSEKLYKYRFIVALITFLICVIFKINGSSIGLWNLTLYGENEDDKVLAGVSRTIRSDEWAVTTPTIFSQEKNEYKHISDFLRANETEMFTLIGAPVKDISIIFRLFQIGYILFGFNIGLSFAWCGRFIVLFLSSFEFIMLITNKNKKISLIGTILIVFSPTIQWWYGGLIDMIVAGEVGILLVDKLLKERKTLYKIAYMLGIFIAIGNYIFTMYPAWMITLFYCFLPILIWIIFENRKNTNITKKEIIVFLIIMVFFCCLILRIGFFAKNTIISSMNTVYPGKRIDLGGGSILGYIKFALDSFLMYYSGIEKTEIDFFENQCEMSVMMDFWPILLIFLCIYFIKEKNNKKDFFIKISVVFSLFLNIYYIFGLPEFISKITFLQYTTSERAFQVLGLLNIFILMRIISIYNIEIKEKNAKKIALFLVLITIIAVLFLFIYLKKDLILSLINNQITKKLLIKQWIKIIIRVILVIVSLYGSVYYYFCTYRKNSKKLIVTVVVLMILSTGLVNPIRIGGFEIFENSYLIQEIENINNNEEGIWATIDFNIPMNNAPILAGVKTINSTQFYPNLEVWEKIDVDKNYQEVYNRYAHVTITLDEQKEKFKLDSTDSFTVYLTQQELKELNIKYIICSKEFEKDKYNNLNLKKLYEDNLYKIYKIL